MYHSLKHRLTFIRIPKTGSTTAYDTLNKAIPDFTPNGDTHESYAEMQARSARRAHDTCDRHNAFPLSRVNTRVIAFVRHPLDWLPSFFAMLPDRNRYADKWVGGGCKRFRPENRTSEYLENLAVTPYDWFTDKDGVVRATEVWRTEDMAGFCASWQKPWQHINQTGVRRRVELDWTPRDLQVIKEKFRRELKHYPERPIVA